MSLRSFKSVTLGPGPGKIWQWDFGGCHIILDKEVLVA